MGVLWGTKVDAVTFFGANPEFVYGIQMLPFTPASEALLDPTWIKDAWPQMSSAAAVADQGWRGMLYMAHGVIDKNAAFTEPAGSPATMTAIAVRTRSTGWRRAPERVSV